MCMYIYISPNLNLPVEYSIANYHILEENRAKISSCLQTPYLQHS